MQMIWSSAVGDASPPLPAPPPPSFPLLASGEMLSALSRKSFLFLVQPNSRHHGPHFLILYKNRRTYVPFLNIYIPAV